MPSNRSLGLIAGAGDLPLFFANQARHQGFSVRTVAIRGVASPKLSSFSDAITWVSVGQLGALLSFFKKQSVTKAVMHGKVQHAGFIKDPRMDFKALSVWMKLKERSGESLLKALASELLKTGIRLIDGRYLMEPILTGKGWQTHHRAKDLEMATADYGLQKARILAKEAIGQSLLVRKKAIIAVEAIEGTDEAILRAGKWAGPGAILVKVASPKQDWRFDIPTIGLKTVQNLIRIKAKGIVLEAGRSFLLDRGKVIALADRHRIFIQGVFAR